MFSEKLKEAQRFMKRGDLRAKKCSVSWLFPKRGCAVLQIKNLLLLGRIMCGGGEISKYERQKKGLNLKWIFFSGVKSLPRIKVMKMRRSIAAASLSGLRKAGESFRFAKGRSAFKRPNLSCTTEILLPNEDRLGNKRGRILTKKAFDSRRSGEESGNIRLRIRMI